MHSQNCVKTAVDGIARPVVRLWRRVWDAVRCVRLASHPRLACERGHSVCQFPNCQVASTSKFELEFTVNRQKKEGGGIEGKEWNALHE
jgi:hypothetical protein